MKTIIDPVFKTQLTTAILTVPIVYIPHYHYSYVDQALKEILFPVDRSHNLFSLQIDNVCEFDLSRGEICFAATQKEPYSYDLIELLRQIANGERFNEKKIFLLKGIAKELESSANLLQLMQFCADYEQFEPENRIITVIIVDDTPFSLLPSPLLPLLHSIEIPLPDEAQIAQIIQTIPISKSIEPSDVDNLRKTLAGTFKGLHQYQIINILNTVLIKTGNCLTHQVVMMAQNEKKQIVHKSGVLEVIESDVNLDQIGGLDILREDIRRKALIFKNLDFARSSKVRLPLPKGILIIGMPGCGKSMIAKAIANEFSIPLLRLDINRLMGQYVGLSEENLRKALAAAEATHPCVLWIDEVEKAFAGSQHNGGVEDSLVVRLMGCFLTWMQERKAPVYIVATANDVMRSEFMRKGRFDEVYFVDFPKEKECEDILRKKIERYTKVQKDISTIYNFSNFENDQNDSLSAVAALMQHCTYGGFSGAEIESVVTAVVEMKFIEYLNNFGQQVNGIVQINISDFRTVIEGMAPSVMANQKGTNNQTTNVERIRAIQEIYKFKKASKQ